ncbi:MAG: TrmH family RNA methyltransferase [Bacillota bacterium]
MRIFTENDVFQQLMSLSINRRKRHQAKRCLVEGVKPINLAIANGWAIEGLIYAQGAHLSSWAKDVIATSGAKTHYELAPHLMEALNDKEETSELIAVVSTPGDDLARIRVGLLPLLVVLDQPSSPGNLGSIIRSCDALRVDGVAVLGHSADIYDPQTIRASLGTVFSTPVVRLSSMNQALEWFKSLKDAHPGLMVIGTSAKADTELDQADPTQPTVLVFGNETRGMSWNLREACDLILRIPICGSASSLNLACAASIVLYEVDRQRRRRQQQS